MRNTCEEKKARAAANRHLAKLGGQYHPAIPNGAIDDVLTGYGFREMESGIYCGRDGRVSEQVGDRTWLTMTWHKMEETGRFEIVAYLS